MNSVKPSFEVPTVLIRYGLLIILSLIVAACSNDDLSDLRSYVAQIKAKDKVDIEPLPEIQTVETFVFDPEGLRNPFVPTANTEESSQIAVENGIRPDEIRSREELESYSLDSLRMVGTVNMKSSLWGLIQANDGTIHRVRNGNYMGKNHGKIIRVMDDQIELLEIITDGPGTWREKQSSVKLAE